MVYSSVDFCSGAGGMSAGLRAIGVEPILGIDLDRYACDTYRATGTRTVRGNVSELAGMVDILGCRHADLLVGGPPCQPFSVHGRQRGALDSRDAVPYFIATLAAMRPRAFLFENVENLGAQRHRAYLNTMLDGMTAAGYSWSMRVLDAADYGVAQHRRRLFVVGFRQTSNVVPLFLWPERTHGTAWSPWRTAGEVLQQTAPGPPNPSRVIYAKNPVLRPRLINSLLVNGKGRALDLSKPAPTIAAESSGNGGHLLDSGALRDYHGYLRECSRAGIVPTLRTGPVPGAVRLTWRQMAALQGFPADYPFQGPVSSIHRQIGNAVPPPVAAAIGRAVVAHLEAYG